MTFRMNHIHAHKGSIIKSSHYKKCFVQIQHFFWIPKSNPSKIHNSNTHISLALLASINKLPNNYNYFTNVVDWVRVVHFLHRDLIFCRVPCIFYMLLTWHKNNNFPNFWLDLDFQLEEKYIYKKNYNIYTPNIYNELLKLKNMEWFVVCAFIYMHAFLCLNFIWDIL
jgi:hypothetical protein